MMEETGRRRTSEIRLKLSPSIAEEFSALSASYGLLPPTMAAFVVGQFVERCRTDARVARLVALDASKRLSETMADPSVLEASLTRVMSNPDVLRAMFDASPDAEGCKSQGEGSPVPDRKSQPESGGGGVSHRSGRRGRVRTAT